MNIAVGVVITVLLVGVWYSERDQCGESLLMQIGGFIIVCAPFLALMWWGLTK